MWVQIKKVSKSLFWHVFSKYSFSVFAKLKSVSHPPLQMGFQCDWGSLASVKEPACQCRRCKRQGFGPWVRKVPWRRAWRPPPVFLPGESHGQRSLVGQSPWGHTESDSPEAIHVAFGIHMCNLESGSRVAVLLLLFLLVSSVLKAQSPCTALQGRDAQPFTWGCIIHAVLWTTSPRGAPCRSPAGGAGISVLGD